MDTFWNGQNRLIRPRAGSHLRRLMKTIWTGAWQANDANFVLQLQGRPFNETAIQQLARFCRTAQQRRSDLCLAKGGDLPRYQARAQITVRLKLIRRTSDDSGMTGQIDRIGYDGGSGISLCGRARQNCDSVRNAKREAAAMISAGRNAGRRIMRVND